jgi:hypothetical protein
MFEMATSLASMVEAFQKKRLSKIPGALTPPLRLPQDPLKRAIVTLKADGAFSDMR